MGYRSDVALYMYATHVDDAPVVKLWLKEHFPEGWDSYIRWTDKGMMFYIEHVKWYDDEEEIKAVHKCMEDFNDLFIRTPRENMPECALEFMRIGEDDDDVKCERRGACDYVMSMERKIILEV
jgi:hypothetical protein